MGHYSKDCKKIKLCYTFGKPRHKIKVCYKMDVRYTVCDTKYKNTSVYLKDKSIKGAANKPKTKKAGGKPPRK